MAGSMPAKTIKAKARSKKVTRRKRSERVSNRMARRAKFLEFLAGKAASKTKLSWLISLIKQPLILIVTFGGEACDTK